MMETTRRILLVDDHRLIRQSLRSLLESVSGWAVVHEAGDGVEALDYFSDEQVKAVDLVIMDVSMPHMDGIETTRRLHEANPELPVLILTMHDEPSVQRDAIKAGAVGFVTKDAASEQLIDAVHAVFRGETAFPSVVRERLVTEGSESTYQLSAREITVLQLIADGKSTEMVAETLFISVKTVKNHLASIFEKLDARDRTQAVLEGLRAGILRLR